MAQVQTLVREPKSYKQSSMAEKKKIQRREDWFFLGGFFNN